MSTLLAEDADSRLTRRHVRYAQREVLWRESGLERVRKCGRVPLGGDVMIRGNEGIAHYAGLTSCGSIWSCPVCSAKIRNRRADEISAAAALWHRKGNHVYAVTLTAPHDLGDRLDAMMRLISDGFRAVISGRPWRRLCKQLGVVGQIRSLEVTHGWQFGWHPHLHVLVFARAGKDTDGAMRLVEAELAKAELAGYMRDRWSRFITGQGYRPPHETHGVDVQLVTSAREAGAYIAKTQDGKSPGNELARGDLKEGREGNRTPFQVLDDFRWTGNEEDLVLWHEYERATKGHQAITWSKGLREILGAEDEVSDEEIAAEEIGGDDIALIPAETWREVTKIPGLSGYLLDRAEDGGLAAVNAVLAAHGIGEALPPSALV